MRKITGFLRFTTSPKFSLAALMLIFVSAASQPAFACRGIKNWSTGTDLTKLKAGEVVVKAKLIESYKNEVRFPSIMGIAHGMIYYVEITETVGSTDVANAELQQIRGNKIYIRLKPSICEAYYPRDFSKESTKTLVLKKGITGLFDLVGGQE